ncbi:MAG: thiol-disulfide oxidoreductase DCC family protein [Dermatophilaceae bacterium]
MLAQPPTRHPTPPLLVFDGDCGICTRLAEAAARWIPPRGGTITASRWVDLGRYHLTEEQCRLALQYVDRRGRVYSAQDAVARLLLDSHLWWWPTGAILRLPGIHHLAGLVYRWVARNRYRLPGGTPACRVVPPRPG